MGLPATLLPRGTLRLSPLLMLMLRLIPGWRTDTTDTDSGHTDTAPTRRISLRLQIWWLRISLLRISMLHTPDICTDTTQLCSESQSRHLESHLSKNSETKKV